MMYKDMLAVAIKHNGKILREQNADVFIPFGSEYSVMLKNTNTLRCLVSIEIDGEDVAGGHQFVVPANASIDIERFIKQNNREQGQRFKFIERTARIEDHRGIKIDDGLLRVTFEFEKRYVAPTFPQYNPGARFGSIYDDPYNRSLLGGSLCDTSRSLRSKSVSADLCNVSYASASATSVNQAHVQTDVGITVGGSVSDQKFSVADWFATDGVQHVMVLNLKGMVAGQEVKQALTVKTKQKCPTCGHMNKSSTKFCAECGTGLMIPA